MCYMKVCYVVLLFVCLAHAQGHIPLNAPILFPDDRFFLPGITPQDTLPDEQFSVQSRSSVNGLTNITQFAAYYELDLPEIFTPEYDDLSVSVRFGGSEVLGEEFPQASCEPELMTKVLDLPQEPGVTYFPTCIRIEQCGGCCLLPDMTCQPVSVQDLDVKVLRVQDGGFTRSSTSGGRRKRSQTMYINVIVERHIQCECQCITQKSDCDLSIHDYDPDKCSCICQDRKALDFCLGDTNHEWDNKTCSCKCKERFLCSTGQRFNENTCRCH